MDMRQTVAARDAGDRLCWFLVADAQKWSGKTVNGGQLFRVAGRWVLLDELADLCGTPAKIIDDEAALSWLLASGYEPTGELSVCAAPRMLR